MNSSKLLHNQQTNNTEIERKFVIDKLPSDLDLSACTFHKITQGYLVTTPKAAVRLRSKGENYYLTYKATVSDHAAKRVELETQITKQQFDILWPGTGGKHLEKTRYIIPFGQHTIELDIFEGSSSGHMLAEVEFLSTHDADMFEPPEGFDTDVTTNAAYTNSIIAEAGFTSKL